MQGMSFYGFTGVHESEKQAGQVFLTDVVLELPLMAACESDNLDDTVSYAQAYEIIRQVYHHESYDLVERLCGEIAKRLFEAFPTVQKLTVTVRKPQAPIDGDFEAMGVRITRQRSDFPGMVRP